MRSPGAEHLSTLRRAFAHLNGGTDLKTVRDQTYRVYGSIETIHHRYQHAEQKNKEELEKILSARPGRRVGGAHTRSGT